MNRESRGDHLRSFEKSSDFHPVIELRLLIRTVGASRQEMRLLLSGAPELGTKREFIIGVHGCSDLIWSRRFRKSVPGKLRPQMRIGEGLLAHARIESGPRKRSLAVQVAARDVDRSSRNTSDAAVAGHGYEIRAARSGLNHDLASIRDRAVVSRLNR
jgi:hypothetical protein